MPRHKQEKPTKETFRFYESRHYHGYLDNYTQGDNPGNYRTPAAPTLDDYDNRSYDFVIDNSTGLLTMEWRRG